MRHRRVESEPTDEVCEVLLPHAQLTAVCTRREDREPNVRARVVVDPDADALGAGDVGIVMLPGTDTQKPKRHVLQIEPRSLRLAHELLDRLVAQLRLRAKATALIQQER